MKADNVGLVSVIIPIYNAEKYLIRCLESVICQTYHNIEIIMIDDGSTDSSGNICDDYCVSDKRCVVYHVANGGVSKARNIGLELARGEYITFVDADDYIDEKHIQYLFDNCYDDVDIVLAGAEDYREDGDIIYKAPPKINTPITIEINENYSFSGRWHRTVIWGSLYKKSVIGNLKFDTSLYVGEDSYFYAAVLHNSKRIRHIPLRTYNYIHYSNSASHGRFDLKKYTELDSWEKIVHLFCDRPQIQKTCTYEYVKRCIEMYAVVYNSGSVENKSLILKKIIGRCRGYIKIKNIAYPTFKSKMRIWVFKISPSLFMLFSNLKNLKKYKGSIH